MKTIFGNNINCESRANKNTIKNIFDTSQKSEFSPINNTYIKTLYIKGIVSSFKTLDLAVEQSLAEILINMLKLQKSNIN